MYQAGGETYCCEWTIRWNFHLEPFTLDGESSGLGRFVGLLDGVAAVQLWLVPGGLKVEHAPGFTVQLDIDNRTITIIKKS